MALCFFYVRRPLGQKAGNIIVMIISMPIKRNLLKVTIIATVGLRIIAATTKGIIMRNDRSIPSEDTLVDAVPIIITGRHQDTIIVSITIIFIHTATAFGFFGGANRTSVLSY